MSRFTNYKGDKNKVRDYGQNTNLQQRTSFDSYYSGNTKYYSGIDAEIYIGSQYVDEVFNIRYNIMQESKPIFGYNSYLYDEMAVGSRIVTGTFSINFTETNFLGKVLNSIQKRKIISGADTILNNQNSYSNVQTTSMDPSIYRSKAPLWDQQFEILIAYGEKNKKIFGGSLDNIEVIKGVQLNSRETQFSALGEPIMEVYGFTARDIIYGGETRQITDEFVPEKDNIEDIKEQEKTKGDYVKINNSSYRIEPSKSGLGQEIVFDISYELTKKDTDISQVRSIPSFRNSYSIMNVQTRGKLGSDINNSITIINKDIAKNKDFESGEKLSLYMEFDIIVNNDKNNIIQETHEFQVNFKN